MQTFSNLGPRNAVTPQSEPIPGSTQVLNDAGGYVWAVDDWMRLERFLILGTEGGTYYTDERKLTRENAAVVERCIAADGVRTVQTISTISTNGRAPKNDPALFALAMCAGLGDPATRSAAFEVLPQVARIGTHILHFLSYVEQFRGWGRGLRHAVGRWFISRDPRDLAYQVTKYPQRDAWALRDALRLAHPKAPSEAHNAVLRYAANKPVDVWPDEALGSYMAAVAALKASTDPKAAAMLIADHRLTREVVPSELLTHTEVWEALLIDMPYTAMLRNLANMTRLGLIAPLSAHTRLVAERLVDPIRIKGARAHPIALLSALRTYAGGRGIRGQNTWTPVPHINDALEAAFYQSFGALTPSGARTLLALDVSSSMRHGMIAGVPGLSPAQAEAAMAMVTARTEPNYHILGFAHELKNLGITASMALPDVERRVTDQNFGGTDCSVPMVWAKDHKVDVDVFVIYTDNETWAGNGHPSQRLRDYRQARGIAAKLVVVAMTSAGFSIADPNDAGMLDVVGFDTAAPHVIADFARPVQTAVGASA